jgi:murein DD-endopeptidase MepM/ murein hydrolase activator NlpD
MSRNLLPDRPGADSPVLLKTLRFWLKKSSKVHSLWIGILLGFALLSACDPSPISTIPTAPTLTSSCPTSQSGADEEICLTDQVSATPFAVAQGAGPILSPADSATQTPSPPQIPSPVQATPVQASTTSPTATSEQSAASANPDVCQSGQCTYPMPLLFNRPIARPANDQVDTSYRFGSTQGKKRDPHHGVEFLNPQGTPVLAAADGVVVVAGDDKKTLYSPYYNFYGNLVVIQHDPAPGSLKDLPDFPKPLYTLYAHLSEVLVEPGQKVRQGQEIGLVGMTGGATGSHLHFEVRLGENTYKASRNPELWLQPDLDDAGQTHGALAGRVIDPQGNPVAVKNIVIQHLVDGPQSTSDWEIYLDSYEEKALLGNPPWEESFGVGNLPAGWYRVSFPYYGLQRQEVQILPGQITEVVFDVK